MPFPILFGTTLTTILHYRADCDENTSRRFKKPDRNRIRITLFARTVEEDFGQLSLSGM